MGEAKKRKEQMGSAYGKPRIGRFFHKTDESDTEYLKRFGKTLDELLDEADVLVADPSDAHD